MGAPSLGLKRLYSWVSSLPRVMGMKDTRVSMTHMGVRPQGTPPRRC